MSGLSSQLSNIKTRLKEAGNVLFMILIAVALFAALAYAVTQSTRSGGGDTSREETKLSLSQMMQFGAELETTVQRLTVSNNCTLDQISFENNIVSGYTNPNSPANYTCHVFRPEGGGIVYRPPPLKILLPSTDPSHIGDGWGEYVFTANFVVANMGLSCGGTTCNDMMFTVSGITPDACAAINGSLLNDTSIPEAETWAWGPSRSGSHFWKGTWQSWAATYFPNHPAPSILTDQRAGCFKRWRNVASPTSNYIFFYLFAVR